MWDFAMGPIPDPLSRVFCVDVLIWYLAREHHILGLETRRIVEQQQ